MTTFQLISGLPWAGSTLLAALLAQNPALRAGIVSPVGSLVAAVLRDTSQGNETSHQGIAVAADLGAVPGEIEVEIEQAPFGSRRRLLLPGPDE